MAPHFIDIITGTILLAHWQLPPYMAKKKGTKQLAVIKHRLVGNQISLITAVRFILSMATLLLNLNVMWFCANI